MKKLAKLTNIIESILFVSGTQVAVKDIAEKLEISEKYLVLCSFQGKKSKYGGYKRKLHLYLELF